MFAGARRHLSRVLTAAMRRASSALCVWVTLAVCATSSVADIISAEFKEPTTRYGHGVLGDDIEYGALEITSNNHNTSSRLISGTANKRTRYLVRLPLDHVFEDIAPRLVDVTGDDAPEVIVVETDVARGAQLAIYGAGAKKLAATPHIGRSNRWLAPIGAADLDGDGHVEIAYIDRPHLARTLRIWRFAEGALSEVGTKKGLTNHRIGQGFISGGIRDCGSGAEIITVDAGWQNIMVSTFDGKTVQSRAIGPFGGQVTLDAALDCKGS